MKNLKQKLSISLLSLIIGLSGLAFAVPLASAAGTATMYLSPASGSHLKGSTFSVSVYEDSTTDQINAAEADLSYSASQLQYVSHSLGSAFDLAGPSSGGGGSVKISAAKSASSLSGNQKVATVNFKVLGGSGTATVSFTSGSAVYKYSDGSPLSLSTSSGSYALTSPPPAAGGTTSSSSTPKASTATKTSTAPTASHPTKTTTSSSKPSTSTTAQPVQGASGTGSPKPVTQATSSSSSSKKLLAGVVAAITIGVVTFMLLGFRNRSAIQPPASSKIELPNEPLKGTGTIKGGDTVEGKSLFNKVFVPTTHASLAVYLLVFAAFGGYATWRIFAASPTPPTVYLNPSSQNLAVNTNFTVEVRENSGTNGVNAVQANFSYPANLVDFVSIDTTGTAFNIDAPSSGGNGQVNIARGLASTSVTGDQLVAKVTFKTKATGGSVPMAFITGTALVSYSTNQDILGSLSNTGGATYTVDTTAPTATLTAPANGASIGLGTTATISATASDSGGAVSKLDVYVDGALKSTINGAGPYSYNWNTSGLTLGNHTVQVKATDSAGNVGSSSTITVTIADKTAPAVPANFRVTATTQTSATLAWNASTDNVGVTSYKLTRGATVVTTTSALTFTENGLTAGTNYTYTVVAMDAAGNTSTAATVSANTQSLTPGDITGDGKVDTADLSRMAAHWQGSTLPFDATCDLNHDGSVNTADLSILAKNWSP